MTTLGFVLLIITWVIVGLATKDRKHTPQTINHNHDLDTVIYMWQAQPKR